MRTDSNRNDANRGSECESRLELVVGLFVTGPSRFRLSGSRPRFGLPRPQDREPRSYVASRDKRSVS